MKPMLDQKLSDNPQGHDFDWMDTYLNCSVDCEFVELKHAAHAAWERYKTAWEKNHPQSNTEFGFNATDDNSCFNVYRKIKDFQSGTSVKFSRENDHILVEQNNTKEYKITLTINDEGQCRYKISGEQREFLRWQVLKKMLLNVVFLSNPG